jgi:hypothetical protein
MAAKMITAPIMEMPEFNPFVVQGLGLNTSLTIDDFWKVINRFQDFDELTKNRNISISFRANAFIPYKFSKDNRHLLLTLYYYLLFSEMQHITIICPISDNVNFVCECASYKYEYDDIIETLVHIREDGQSDHIIFNISEYKQ